MFQIIIIIKCELHVFNKVFTSWFLSQLQHYIVQSPCPLWRIYKDGSSITSWIIFTVAQAFYELALQHSAKWRVTCTCTVQLCCIICLLLPTSIISLYGRYFPYEFECNAYLTTANCSANESDAAMTACYYQGHIFAV